MNERNDMHVFMVATSTGRRILLHAKDKDTATTAVGRLIGPSEFTGARAMFPADTGEIEVVADGDVASLSLDSFAGENDVPDPTPEPEVPVDVPADAPATPV
jgi:hypothetical protein